MPAEMSFSGLFRPIILIMLLALFAGSCTKDEYQPNSESDVLKAAGINEVIPANLAESVEVNPVVSVTFATGTEQSKLSAIMLYLKKGSSPVPGRTVLSGTTVLFTPDKDLSQETEYTATIKTGQAGGSNNSDTHEYSWIFKTGKDRHPGSRAVVSTDPLKNATNVPIGTMLTVTFDQELTPTMKSSTLIMLKKGQTSIEGSLSFSGSSAIFIPSVTLEPNTLYSCRVKMGTGNQNEDDKSGDSYYWSFKTTATPVVLSFASDVIPVLNQCNNCHKHPWTTSSDASTYYTNLVNGGYVNLSDPTSGKIYTRLYARHAGSSISKEDINKILNWLTQGSKNN